MISGGQVWAATFVQYDNSGNLNSVTLEGGSGTVIKNLANGSLASGSKEAVNGGQLFTTNENVTKLTNQFVSVLGGGASFSSVTGLYTAPSYTIQATSYSNIGSTFAAVDSALTTIQDSVDGITTYNQKVLDLDDQVNDETTGLSSKASQADLTTLSSRAVQYDTDEKDVISLKAGGTKITNVTAGDISTATSTDAVNGGQLFTTNKNVSDLYDQVNDETTGLATKVSQSDFDDLSNLSVQYDTTAKDTISLKGTNGTTIKNVANGTLASDSKDAVNGGQLFATNQDVAANKSAITDLDVRVSDTEDTLSSLTLGQSTLNSRAVQYDVDGSNNVLDVIKLKGTNGTTIKNVADGTLASDSKDAVNGGQLYTTNQNVSNLTNRFNTSANQFASVLGGGASFTNGVFTAPSYTIQSGSYLTIGSAFDAVDDELTAIKGSVTTSNGTNLVAAQSYTDTKTAAVLQEAMDYINELKTTILNSANTYTDQAVSGVQSTDGEFVSVNGSTATSGASATGTNSVAIGTNTTVTGNNSTAVGIGNTVSGNKSGAFGDPNTVTGNGSYVVGNDNTVSGDNTFVLGNNVNTSAANSVVLGNNSTSDRDNTVSVGSSTNQRQITNVAAGTEDTDAVNVAQLNQSSADTLSSANSYTDTKFANIESVFKDYSLQTERRFQEVNKRFDRQGAMSAAMMNMATSTSGLQGRNRIGVGAGLQGQEQAVAVGYQRVVNSNTTLTISGALSREESSGGVGVGFGW